MRDERLKVLFDGECPLCRREADLLRWLDRGRGRLILEDITAGDFDPARYGTTMEALMAEIHGVLPNDRLIKGMEVFRRAYAAVGLPWLLAPTRWPILRRVADRAYGWFAGNRLRLTGQAWSCDSGRCHPAQGGRARRRLGPKFI